MSEFLVEMKNISKQFNGEEALHGVDFFLKRGEIHGLLGENGAGKSVLMSILAGVNRQDSGEIYFEGKKVDFFKPKDARDLGITTIYQDINLAEDLSIAENIFFSQWPVKGKLIRTVDWKKLFNDSEKILNSIEFNVNPRTRVKKLNPAQKQMVEIAKLLSQNSKIVIMDEPYTGLTETERENFHSIVESLKKSGISIIYISHRMDDVLRICDSITILRQGRIVERNQKDCNDKSNIIKLLVGKDLKENYPKLNSKCGRVILKVNSIYTDRGLENVSFNLKKGEILGIAGLIGSGRTAIARALFGMDKLRKGEIYINDTLMKIASPQDAIKVGIGYLAEDRLNSVIVDNLNIAENISLANLHGVNRAGFLKLDREKEIARSFVKAFVIKTPKIEQNVLTLSGGSQQKVALCKWIFTDSKILILDEPTKGIDKSTKVEIYNFMNKYVLEGNSIIFISSDLQELMGMSDRIIGIYSGRIKIELDRSEFSKEKIIYSASGVNALDS